MLTFRGPSRRVNIGQHFGRLYRPTSPSIADAKKPPAVGAFVSVSELVEATRAIEFTVA
jgi:hypothetical protein